MSIEREVVLAARDMRAAAQSFRTLAQDSKYASDYINTVRHGRGGNNPSYRGRLERIRSQRNIDSFLKTLADSDELNELDKASAVDSRVRTSKEFETYKELQSRRLKLSNPSAYKTSILQEKYGAFAVDAEQIERAEQSAEASSYIDSLLNQKKYRDDQGRKKWGSNWDRVKLAEDKANTRAVIMNTLGLNKLTALMKSPLGAVGLAVTAAGAITKGIDRLGKEEGQALVDLYGDESKHSLSFNKSNSEAFKKYLPIAREVGHTGDSFAKQIAMWDRANALYPIGGDKKMMERMSRTGIYAPLNAPFEVFKEEMARGLADPRRRDLIRHEWGLSDNDVAFYEYDTKNGMGRKRNKDLNRDELRRDRTAFLNWKKNQHDKAWEESWLSGIGHNLWYFFTPESAEYSDYKSQMDEKKGFKDSWFQKFWDRGVGSWMFKSASASSTTLMNPSALGNLTASPQYSFGDVVINANSRNKEELVSEVVSAFENKFTNALSGMFGD